MPRYYLHIRGAEDFAPDEEGLEAPCLGDAERAAIAGARSLLSADVAAGELDLRGAIEIADENGAVIRTVRFSDVLTIRTPARS
jgi:hypothetical protein